MKLKTKFALAGMAALATLASAAPAQEPVSLGPDDEFGTPPPADVKNWIRLSVLGDRTAPFLIIWISPQVFPREGLERLVLVSPREYANFLTTARSAQCLPNLPSRPLTGTLMITEHANGPEDAFCVLSSGAKCDILSAIKEKPDFDSTGDSVSGIRILATSIGCDT